MDVRILDLDGGVAAQTQLWRWRPRLYDAQGWGPRLRLACGFARFHAFERHLAELLGSETDAGPRVTLYGSGDFHHLSLALLHRLATPFNLLVLDKHPDWMGGVPLLHCGTWLAHALKMPLLRHIVHVGGDLDFDNAYRWLAPWRDLRSGRIKVLPALRRYGRGGWRDVEHKPLRTLPEIPLTQSRLDDLLDPLRDDLARWPLYVSVDKDVLAPAEAVVNWDSGHLELAEVEMILAAFVEAAGGSLAGADLIGDWSPVRVRGWGRRLLDYVEHEPRCVDAADAARRNGAANGALLAALGRGLAIRRELCPSDLPLAA